ncbi:MAG: transposase, partial [Actinomycetota bacterium]|nr:transposase [Actinomycetota bacterium]
MLASPDTAEEVPARKPRSRKRPRGAPTHVATLPLSVSPAKAKTCNARFHAGLRPYNACLEEAFKRSAAVKADPRYQTARDMPGSDPTERKLRALSFSAIDTEHGFSESALMSYASSLRKSFIREQVPAQEAQVLGRQAFRAVHRWHVARGGRPRFKAARRGLHSLAAKDRNGALRPVLDAGGQLVGL